MTYTESDFDGFGSEDAFGRLYTEIPNYFEMTKMLGGDIEWTAIRWISLGLAQIPFIPLLSSLGRKCWIELVLKLGHFLAMCMGVWTEEAFTRFRISDKAERLHLKEYIKVGYGQYILAAMLCPRAILLRCIPFFAPLQIFVLQMSTSPLYVGSEQLVQWLNVNPPTAMTWGDKWAKAIVFLPDFLSSLRAYQYLNNLFSFIIAMVLPFSNAGTWKILSILSLVVLIPNAFVFSLGNVVRLGRVMGVKDQDFPCMIGRWDKHTHKVAVGTVEPF
jgi:hypothetical protein